MLVEQKPGHDEDAEPVEDANREGEAREGQEELVRDTLAKMLAGEWTRFDTFAGPITDNTGKEVLADGEKLEQSDLDQFPPGAPGNECATCMYWWADGITVELPALE